MPYWNYGNSEPPLDTWTTETIDGDKGILWSTRGFGTGDAAGGPPLNTLNEWLAQLSTDFADADLVQVSLGVGSYNQGQIGYVDNVSIAHSAGAGYSAAYNFDFTSVDTTSGTDTAVAAEAGVAGDGGSRAAFDPRPVPLPSLWLVPLVIALGGLAARRNRRR